MLILIAYILFAVNIPVSKYLLPAHVLPEGLTIMRISFACVLFWITSSFTKCERVTLKEIGLLFFCGFTGVALNQWLFIKGLNITSPVDAAIIATGIPVFVMLLAALILKEPVTKLKASGVLLGIIGAVMLILFSSQQASQVGSLKGNLMVMCSGLSYSIYLVINKPLTQKYSSVTIMKWMFLFSTLILIPFTHSDVLRSSAFTHETADYKEIAAILFVLVGATYIPYLLIPMSLKRIRPTTVSMYNYVQPIVASFIAIFAGQDTFGIEKLFAAVLVFAGVYLVTRSKSRADLEAERPKE